MSFNFYEIITFYLKGEGTETWMGCHYRPWCFCSGWQVGQHPGWSPECLGCLYPQSTASSTESLRRWWPFVIRSSTSQRPQKTWRRCLAGLQGWQDTEPSGKQLGQSTAAMSTSSYQAALVVGNTGTGCFLPFCRLCVTIRAALLTHTWAGLGQSTTPECSATVHSTGGHSNLLQGTSSLPTGGYPCLQHPLPLITPYRMTVQGVGAQRFNIPHCWAHSIIERAFGLMKARFLGHLPSSAGGALHLGTLRHNIMCHPPQHLS
ncbi:uncharacterized protein LOC114556677 [Perca flavescens]|uniref:uncharacterized protein LOC114556677 n=1 Tax=Perca flavescens TaxID=8167 RepID=UPI00106ED002|nr:uncharacterized protein LOC114556677 [Perca flavescens]